MSPPASAAASTTTTGNSRLRWAAAIELPYAKRNIFRIGLRDFRPKAVEALVQANLVGMTAAGKYYLKKRLDELNL